MPRLLETERLKLRHYTPRDYEDFLALNGDGEVRRFIGGVLTEERAKPLFESFIQEQDASTWAIVTQESGHYVGHAFLDEKGDETPEMGFLLTQEVWGQGLGTEVAVRILRHAMDALGYDRVVASVTEDHPASIRVLEKVGMSLESVGCDDLGRYRVYLASRDMWRGPLASD